MKHRCLTLTVTCALALTLSACDRSTKLPAPELQGPAAPDLPVADAEPPVPAGPLPIASATPIPVPEEIPYEPREPSTARDPAQVLQDWAKAVEARDWSLVRAFWGDHGERSGLSVIAFAAKWRKLRQPEVTIGKGDSEGGAGSLYYTAPLRISDGPRILAGEIVIRRVNDVDGATAEQLRWHIESTSIEP